MKLNKIIENIRLSKSIQELCNFELVSENKHLDYDTQMKFAKSLDDEVRFYLSKNIHLKGSIKDILCEDLDMKVRFIAKMNSSLYP